MKKKLALTTLSIKIAMLLCVSCMSFGGTMHESVVAKPSPCHQESSQETKTQESCEMSETALDVWGENAITNLDNQIIELSELPLVTDNIFENFVRESKPLEGVYHFYYPPPLVLLKSVTPNTKNIIVLS